MATPSQGERDYSIGLVFYATHLVTELVTRNVLRYCVLHNVMGIFNATSTFTTFWTTNFARLIIYFILT